MTRLSFKSLLIITVLLLIGIVALFRIQQIGKTVQAAWFNESWSYRKTLNIGYSGTSSNVQVKIFSNYDLSALVTAGKLQADLDDLRFTDAVGKTISYWIEDATNNSVDIWALIPSVARNGSLIYMYYGNPSATSASSTTNITVGGTMVSLNGARIHTFLGSGTLANTITTNAEVLVVAGGGGGGSHVGGGGGGGGYIYQTNYSVTANENISVTVGIGGTGGPANVRGSNGTNSIFKSLTAYGGGGGGTWSGAGNPNGINGGSGGGASGTDGSTIGTGGSASYSAQGNSGNKGGNDGPRDGQTNASGSGGGGAGTAGQDNAYTYTNPGNRGGGDGLSNSILGTTYYFSGGGGAGAYSSVVGGNGGKGGGAGGASSYSTGGIGDTNSINTGQNGAAGSGSKGGNAAPNSGGGGAGGAGGAAGIGGTGGTGIVIVKFVSGIAGTLSTTEEHSLAPVAYWSFDEGVGTSAFDSSSNRNNGLIDGATWQTEDQCISGKCLQFNGTTSKVTAPYINLTNKFTASVWIKGNSFSNDNGLFYQCESAIADKCIHMIIRSGKPYLGFYAPDLASNTTLQPNIWYYVTYVYDGTYQKIYINGKLDASNTSIAYNGLSGNTYIGQAWGGGANGDFNGYIDEPKIYAYARTATQIKQDYKSGLAGQKSAHGVNVAAGSKSAKSLSDGLVGYWKMDEGVGTTTADSSGNNNTGTFGTGSSAPGWVSGKFGIGLSFGGDGDSLDITNGFTIIKNNNTHTISFWFNAANFTNIPILMNANAYNFFLQTNNSTLYWYLGGAYRSYSVNFLTGQWYHIVVVKTGNGDSGDLYINGVKQNVNSGTIGNTPNIDSNLLLGRFSTGINPLAGSLDEVRIYNRALNPAEVTALYEFAPGPVAYYNFEEGVGSTAFDKSGNGYNFYWNGTLGSQWKAGKIGSAGYFNGTDNYLRNSVIPNPRYQMTVSAWIKTIGGFNYGGIVSYHYNQFRLCKDEDRTNGTEYSFEWNGQWNVGIGISKSLIEDGKWHYLTGVYDGSYIRNYLDGKEMNKYAYVGTIASPYSGLVIGRLYYDSDAFFTGSIDEVKIYNYARTQKQILQDMSANIPVGAATKVNKPIAWYKFDEGQGTVANNSGSIGSTLNGTATNTTWVNEGKINKALNFDGASTYYLLSNSAILLNSSQTYSVWVYPKSISGLRGILTTHNHSTPSNIGINQKDNHFNISIGYTDGTREYDIKPSNFTITQNKWTYVTLRYDLSDNSVSFYINGQFDSKWNLAKTVNFTAEKILAGQWSTAFINDSYKFSGFIDEPKIYNYALSADEIKQDYNQGSSAVIGKSNQSIGGTTTSLDYCIPGDTSPCSAPVGEWKFEEGIGTTAYDTSGNNYNGVWGGTLGNQWKAGKVGSAGYFNGTNYVQTPSFAIPNTGVLTIEAWMKSNITNGGYIISDGNEQGTVGHIFLMRYVTGMDVLFYRYADGTDNGVFISNFFTGFDNQWIHIVTVCDYTNKTLKVYRNGVQFGNTTNLSGTPVFPSTNRVKYIGAYNANESYKLTDGSLDNVRIFNYARTPAQIAYDYNKGAPIGWWKMDECEGNIIHDASGLGNTGTITIGAGGSQVSLGTCSIGDTSAWSNGSTGKINSALSFDGTDDSVDTSLVQNNVTEYSIGAWVKTTATQGIIAQDRGSGAGNSIVLYWGPAGCGLPNGTLGGGFDSNGICLGQRSTQTINDGLWHHAVVVWKGISGQPVTPSQFTIYIDGRAPAMTTFDNSGARPNAPLTGLSGTKIGYHQAWNVYSNGLIDDVRIYNYALTAEQVKSVYNGGAVNFR